MECGNRLNSTAFLPIVPTGESGILFFNLIFIVSTASYLVSPFHLCLVLTTEYYKASLSKVLRKVGFIASWIIVIGLIGFFILI